jgi:rare lipoprotein A
MIMKQGALIKITVIVHIMILMLWMPAAHAYQTRTMKGVASWYGLRFHGRITSSGERFNQNHFTLACKTLPLGTKVEIINLENGRRCQARVNDRGPQVKGRSFDVSRAIARKLGFVHKGKARICIKTIARR